MLASACLLGYHFQPFLNNFVRLLITDEGSVPEMRIWSILLIKSNLKWCIHLSRSLFFISTTWWVSLQVDQRVPDGKCSQVLRSTSVDSKRLRASKFTVIKIDWNCNFVGLLHLPFLLQLVLTFLVHHFQPFLNYFVWQRITNVGSLPEMRTWSILFIKSNLKLCVHLSRSLFLLFTFYFNWFCQLCYELS